MYFDTDILLKYSDPKQKNTKKTKYENKDNIKTNTQ